ncbi:competence type IV pilus minor pilin ComGF [Guptibacillus hwajinpoensis]|uniref:Competence protein ComGF n=1 Tax=Guptibacillus hwajinpoensis TaxID=208199 RepID=A0A0J6CNP5_9BACL|nr:competence type IV pilus minor pilin ComGF [Alkalihalobacillus macyae]KMM37851.1 hypothetical protein AB986_00470 [Alkalihalobacillus macyae]
MRNNEKGMTLLELMLTVTILIAIVSVMPLLMNAAVKSTGVDLQHQEAQLFFRLFCKEVREASQITIVGDKVELLKTDGARVLYERYGSSIRRRVNGTGHEVVLQDIRRVKVNLLGKKVTIEVELQNGESEQRMVFQIADEA